LNFSFYIAKRYLFSKKTHNAINIISLISVIGITISSFALVVVLSAFNGIEEVVSSMYNTFDADVRITPKKGKSFAINDFPEEEIKALPSVKSYSKIIEEVVILQYGEQFEHATIKGVENSFLDHGLKEKIIHGEALLNNQEGPLGIIGSGLLLKLGAYIADPNREYEHVSVIAPSRKRKIKHNQNSFSRETLNLSGSFFIGPEFDFTYLIASIDFVRSVLDYGNDASAVEISINNDAKHDEVKAQIVLILGDQYEVKTSYEQNEIIYKTNKTEKLITFLILAFILVLSTFNIIASLTMLILDKKKDIYVLKSMGASSNAIRRVFFLEGMLINLLGGIIGILLGLVVCLMQQKMHLIPWEDSIIDYFPVRLKWTDILFVFITLLLIAGVSSWLPVRYIIRRHFDQFDASN